MLRIEADYKEVYKIMEIGSKLKKARNDTGITQEQAAEQLCVSRQTISNWENNKSYPDIISVIKMSDIYSISLDHLLKEDRSMKQTYQEFLEESTNTVKAKRNLSRMIILSTYFAVWITAMVLFWNVTGALTKEFDIVLRWILLPLLLLIVTITVARNDYWGKGNWFCVAGAAITFLTVPYTQFGFAEEPGTVSFTFRFPNITYMMVGIIAAIVGIGIGSFWKNRSSKSRTQT